MSKRRRSAAQRAATAKMLAANRARRSGKRKSRKAHKAKRAHKTHRRVSHRRARRSRRKARAIAAPVVHRRRRSRRKARVSIRRHRRAGRRKSSRRSHRRVSRSLSLNPAGALKNFIAPITGVVGNLKASFSSVGGALGFAGGAIGAVAGGTLLARAVMPLALRFAPSVAASPMGARAISVLLYYGSGYLLAKFLPVNDKIKKGILAGSVAAAIIEVIRPGTVQQAVAMVPVVGPLIAGNLAGIEPELGTYVERAIAGLGNHNSQYGGAAYALGDTTFGEYNMAGLGDTTFGDTTFGEYNMAGLGALGCSPAAQELVSYDDN